jgi:hypothetical protein
MIVETNAWGRSTPIGPGPLTPWTPAEDLLLATGYLDMQLEGKKLHMWLRERGMLRSPGTIDKRLVDLKCFGQKTKRQRESLLYRKETFDAVELAKMQLKNEIELAKAEAAAGLAPRFEYDPKQPNHKVKRRLRVHRPFKRTHKLANDLATLAEYTLKSEIDKAKMEAATGKVRLFKPDIFGTARHRNRLKEACDAT